MSFCTAITCMDGRVQLPVILFLREHFGVKWVDEITEPGPNRMLANHETDPHIDSITERLMISVKKHDSVGVAVVGHHDCAGNPVGREQQNDQTRVAVRYLKSQLPDLPVIGLWVDANWEVSLIETD